MSLTVKHRLWFAGHLLVMVVAGMKLCAAESGLAGDNEITETNAAKVWQLVSGPDCREISVNLEGEVLWAEADRNRLVLQTAAGGLQVKMDLYGQPILRPGQRVRLTGSGTAGQGLLDEALVDNDGLHALAEKSGSLYLTKGLHPLRAEWFNARLDFSFEVEYAGPDFARRPIPDNVLFRRDEASGKEADHWAQGLNYSCLQGDWEWLPHWPAWLPVKRGTVPNFDLKVRSRDREVGLQFTGCLQVDREGVYTFWTKSDDGSRLYIGSTPLRIEILEGSILPAPRQLTPGQALNAGEDNFWATVEGTVATVHVDPGGALILELIAGTNHMYVEMDSASRVLPRPLSRIRATGLCRNTMLAGDGHVAGRLLVSSVSPIEALTPPPAATNFPVTTLGELRQLAASGQRTGGLLCLTGNVLATTSQPGTFVFEDQTGGVVIQIVHGDPLIEPVEPGQQLVLKGNGFLEGNKLWFGDVALVDNNSSHLRQEKAGVTFLRAGRHPIHLSWFNRQNPSLLEVYYQGPNLSRRKVPDSALVHPELGPGGKEVKWVRGLNYLSSEGDWQSVPKTSGLDPAKAGWCANFDTRLTSRPEKVGLEFSGYLEVPRDGQYFFWLISDDGSLFFIDEVRPRVERGGLNSLSEPMRITPRQILAPDQNNRWAEVDGMVNFASERGGSLFLEITSVYGSMSVEVADGRGSSPLLLKGNRVRIRGICQSALVPGGQGIAAHIFAAGAEQIQLLDNSAVQWSHYSLQTIQEVKNQIVAETDETIVHIRGEARATSNGRMLISDGTGTIEAEIAQPVPTNFFGSLEVIGRLGGPRTNLILRSGIYRGMADPLADDPKKLPLLTTVQQVKQLSREQAQRRYPVKIRGVITLVRGNDSGFILQDDTSAIDAWWRPYSTTSLARVGDCWEVEGETFVEFSPNIQIHRAVRLGTGAMPEPIHPAWDQLLNGSLDTQYVELLGIVTSVGTNGVTLLTRSGKIHVLLSAVTPETLERYHNALVRVRGCVVPVRDQNSQQVLVGQVRLSNVSLTVDEPAPADPFAAGLKHASELFLFDARAGSLQRVKITGQVLHDRAGEVFLRDGTNTIRVAPQSRGLLHPGELIEVVGFPELGGASPVVREAVLRQTGVAPLPAPSRVADEVLFSSGRDGQLITVEARLIGVSGNQRERVLELQSGNREFVARLENRLGGLAEIKPGSLVELTGVYAEQGGGQAAAQQLTSFELLLNSPLDVKVLQQPSWWTLQRALAFAGALALIILAAMFWIILLRRRVEERSVQLAREVQRREQIQQQNLLEKERTRIAKDMHDQLGTNVTQVGLLAELTKKNAGDPGKAAAHAQKICDTAFELGRTLDEIVWAVNPKNDSLDKFCDYLAVQAQELFQLTNTLCRVDLPPEMPGYPLSADVRHNLFLATKEALNNVARHAHAREVWVRFKLEATAFQIAIVDDGKGFELEPKHALRNGLQNMKKRLEDAGGRFAITSRPGLGTEVILAILLNQAPEEPAAAHRPGANG